VVASHRPRSDGECTLSELESAVDVSAHAPDLRQVPHRERDLAVLGAEPPRPLGVRRPPTSVRERAGQVQPRRRGAAQSAPPQLHVLRRPAGKRLGGEQRHDDRGRRERESDPCEGRYAVLRAEPPA